MNHDNEEDENESNDLDHENSSPFSDHSNQSFFASKDGYSYSSDNDGQGNHDPEPSNCYTDEETDNRIHEMDPDSNKNPRNSAENGPSDYQPGSGYHQTSNPSEPRKDGYPKDKGNRNSTKNTNSGAGNPSGSNGEGKGHQGPTHGRSSGGWYNDEKTFKNKLKINHPKHVYDCLLGVLADSLGLYRPALVFAVGLGEVTNWCANDRILHWSENSIIRFGLGLKWE